MKRTKRSRLLCVLLALVLTLSLVPAAYAAPAALPGDLNGDGLINAKDVVLILRHVAGGYGVELTDEVADLNRDDEVNVKDTVLLMRYIAGGYGVEPEPVPSDEVILQRRRDAAEACARRTLSFLWRPEEDIYYTLKNNTDPMTLPEENRLLIKGGRLYQGMPYSYAGGTDFAFLEYAGEPVNGVYPISGLAWQALSGGGSYARVGSDCSSTVISAWNSVGAALSGDTKSMAPGRGFLRVGEYTSNNTDNTNSAATCAENGEQVMYAAYAQLQKADAVVYRGASSGHTMLIVSSDPVYNGDGTINGEQSTVTVLQQGSGAFGKQVHYYDETLGEDVYPVSGVDHVLTYTKLLQTGYLPITCKVLTDPSPVAKPAVTDTQTTFNKDTLLTGTIKCNWMIDTLTMTITDATGEQVQRGAIRSTRGSTFAVKLQKFLTYNPACVLGYIAPDELTSGSYHCTLTCRIVTGAEFTVRDFDFTV